MLEYTTGSAPLPVSLGAAACLTCLLILMGLKLRWFRARMTFDQPESTPTPYVGVYRSTFSDDIFDYRRPSNIAEPIPGPTNRDTSSAKARPLSAPSYAGHVASSSKQEFTNTSINGIPASKVTVTNETKSQGYSVGVKTEVTTSHGNEAKSTSPTEKSGVRFPLFKSKSKEPKAEKSLVGEDSIKQSKNKEVKEVTNETKSQGYSVGVETDVTTSHGHEAKSTSPTEKSGIRFPLFKSKSKEPKAEKSLVGEDSVPQSESKQVKVKDPSAKGAKTKEPKEKAVKSKDTSEKEVKYKEPKVKVVKPKEPKVKEVKPKDPKTKASKPKETKNKAVKVQQPPESEISQNNAFPYVQASSGQPRPPPMPQEGVPLLDAGGYVYINQKSHSAQQQTTMPPAMKTFGSIQPSKGQMNPMVTPIPSQASRGLRNPAAMGMSTYTSPKALSDQHFYVGMEEESES